MQPQWSELDESPMQVKAGAPLDENARKRVKRR